MDARHLWAGHGIVPERFEAATDWIYSAQQLTHTQCPQGCKQKYLSLSLVRQSKQIRHA